MTVIENRVGAETSTRGVASILGVAPGPAAWQYDGNMMDGATFVAVTLDTTHGAIRDLLPYPLEPDLDRRPEVSVGWATLPTSRLVDGRLFAYTMFNVVVPSRFEDVRGKTMLYEYVDSLDGDKTDGLEKLVAMGYFLGMPKKLGNISVVTHGNETTVRCERQGTTLISFRFSVGEEISETVEDLPAIDNLQVRELPTADYQACVEHSVVLYPDEYYSAPERVWRADVQVELRGLELDPLNVLRASGARDGIVMIRDVPKENFANGRVIRHVAD